MGHAIFTMIRGPERLYKNHAGSCRRAINKFSDCPAFIL
jgi:hypothetical protein